MCFCLYFSVNRIKTETGTSILIPSNNEKSNVLRIEGSPKGVALAKAEILQMVKKLVSLFEQNVFTVFNFFVCLFLLFWQCGIFGVAYLPLFNPVTPKILLLILLTVCHTIYSFDGSLENLIIASTN